MSGFETIDNVGNDVTLVITEYPKSGGSWLTSMLGDILDLPKRDIYVNEQVISDKNNKYYRHIRNIPWYAGARSVDIELPCVIKSHELPESPLITFNAK